MEKLTKAGLFDLGSLLAPPPVCMAHGGLKMKDRRRGAVWYCPHAKKITGKGRTQPPCLCFKALASGRAALAKEQRE